MLGPTAGADITVQTFDTVLLARQTGMLLGEEVTFGTLAADMSRPVTRDAPMTALFALACHFPVSFLACCRRRADPRLGVELISLNAATAAYLVAGAATRMLALHAAVVVESEAFCAPVASQLVVAARAVRSSALHAGAIPPPESGITFEANVLMA